MNRYFQDKNHHLENIYPPMAWHKNLKKRILQKGTKRT